MHLHYIGNIIEGKKLRSLKLVTKKTHKTQDKTKISKTNQIPRKFYEIRSRYSPNLQSPQDLLQDILIREW